MVLGRQLKVSLRTSRRATRLMSRWKVRGCARSLPLSPHPSHTPGTTTLPAGVAAAAAAATSLEPCTQEAADEYEPLDPDEELEEVE